MSARKGMVITMKIKQKVSVLVQIAILFIVGVILIGILSLAALYSFSTRYVLERLETSGFSTAEDLKGFIFDFPAHDWLLRYWYDHYDEMDIDYDAVYTGSSKTEEKYAHLVESNPGFRPDYAAAEDVEALSPQDQKLYAEIVYSWLIDRIDYTQSAYDLDYFFCVVTEKPYDQQFILFIAADEGEQRGNAPGQIYPIGKTIKVAKGIQEAMTSTVEGNPKAALSADKKFYDYFYSMTSFDEHEVLLVLTINVTRVRNAVKHYLSDFGLLFVVLMIALAAGCLLMINYLVLWPLKEVQMNISLYKETKDSQTVADNLLKLRSHNEIAELSGDLAKMAEELNAFMIRNEQIAVKEEHDKTELALAGRIQASMLPAVFPPYPDRKDFEIYASMTPAREVGGDFYDFFLVDDSHLCLMIADVSGKGIPAALFMMASKILLEHNVKMGKTPAQVLYDVNTALCNKNVEDMFVTAWIGILDLAAGKMICANAGHEYPIMRKPGEPYEIIKDKHGLVLGGMRDVGYRDYELEMDPGASLFLYTDGLTEAIDPDKQMFGTERIEEKLNTDPDRSPEEIVRGMKEAVGEYVKGMEPFDDLTMMSFTYHGMKE